MSNSFNVVDWISMEGQRLLVNKLVCAEHFNTDYNKELQKEFAIGSSFRVPMPQQFSIRDGLEYSSQSLNRPYTTVNMEAPFGVDFEYDSVEQQLQMERGREAWSKEYLDPAMSTIAQEIDSRAALYAYRNSPNIVGALGTNPSSFDTVAHARQKLIEGGCPAQGKRAMIIPPAVNRSMVGAAIQYFNPADAISKQYKEGSIGRNNGFDWYESMSLYDHTAGVWAGTVEMLAAGQSGASLSLTATTGDTFKAGDVFGIAGVYKVNPMTKRRVNAADLATFVILEDTTAASSAATISVYPPLVGPGSPYQNVDALPAAGADLTLFPNTSNPSTKSGKNGLVLHRNAFALVAVKLEVPKAVESSSQSRDPQTGVSVRFVKTWNQHYSRMEHRLDTMIGFGRLHADACSVRVLAA